MCDQDKFEGSSCALASGVVVGADAMTLENNSRARSAFPISADATAKP
jgi:hypothetical protein